MSSQTDVFTKLVRETMGPAPLTVPGDEATRSVLRRMQTEAADSVVIVDDAGRPLGIVTEQDVCRRIACDAALDGGIRAHMSAPVKTISEREYLYRAIAEMQRNGLRHMPVVDENEKPVGILHLHEAMAVAAAQMTEQIDLLTHTETLAGMRDTKAAQVKIATQLLADGVSAPEIQKLISGINNDLYRRIVDLCRRDMIAGGWGEPPVAFDVIVMGSGGRGESYLYPDQDNGFVLADYPDADHTEIDAWFIELATRMTDALNEVGFAYCNGYVMATNPLWRKTISQWRTQMTQWIGKGAGMVLRLADIFFDFVPVWGSGVYAGQLREHITQGARKAFLLREMFKFDQEHEVALGPFNRLLTDKLEGPNRGKLNLKLTGTLPLVGAVRLAALANGVGETSTLGRINTLYKNRVLSSDEQDYLSGAFRHITGLLLRQQLRDYNARAPVGNHVAVEDLSRRERDMLIDSFKAIKKFRARLRLELTGDVF